MVSLFNLQARPYLVQQAKPSIYRHTRSENLTMAVIEYLSAFSSHVLDSLCSFWWHGRGKIIDFSGLLYQEKFRRK